LILINQASNSVYQSLIFHAMNRNIQDKLDALELVAYL
jgi:hypothetical protein